MSLDPPAYILSLQNNIRARPISWEGAVRAKTITDEDLRKIRSIDKVRKEQKKQTVEADLDGFVGLFLGGGNAVSIFQVAAKRQDIVQYLLVLLGDLIDDIPKFVSKITEHPSPHTPFLPFLNQSSNPEDPIPLLACSVLSSLLSHLLATASKPPKYLDEALPKLYSTIATLAKSTDSGLQDIAVQEYSALLRTKKSRELFWKQRTETLDPLVEILRTAAGSAKDSESIKSWNGTSTVGSSSVSVKSYVDQGLGGGVGIQLLYHVLLVFWQLSFESRMVGKGLDKEHDIIPLYTQLLRVSPKEKVTRLLVATLRNLLAANSSTLLPAANQVRLSAHLTNIQGRKHTDQDLIDDLEELKKMLEDYSKEQTTFDEYAAEVRSGHLRWSPPHRNATFWKENAKQIVEENKGELPKKLADILSKNWDSDRQVLAIACNDVGFLVKEVPEKKAALEKMGLKTKVMELMQADDESVRWESLRAVGEWLRYSFEK